MAEACPVFIQFNESEKKTFMVPNQNSFESIRFSHMVKGMAWILGQIDQHPRFR